MVHQPVRAATTTRRGRVMRVIIVLEFLSALALCGYVVTMSKYPATVMEITVWTQSLTQSEGVDTLQPQVEIFAKTITSQPLVQDTQQQLDDLSPSNDFAGTIDTPVYVYQFVFATLGVPTEVYAGSLDLLSWTVTKFGVSTTVAAGWTAGLYGFNLLNLLHQRTGMPVPNRWLTHPWN